MTETLTPAIRLRGISKTYPGVTALAEIDLDVHRGETLAVIGENGAGKSTLVKILSGVIPAAEHSGSIEIDGRSSPSRRPATHWPRASASSPRRRRSTRS